MTPPQTLQHQLALRLNLCAALTRLRRGPEALEALRETKVRAPENAKVWFRLGHAHASLGARGLPDAADAFAKAAALAPSDPAVRAALADVRGRIKAGQAATRQTVSAGLSRAFASNAIYSGHGDGGGGGQGGDGGEPASAEDAAEARRRRELAAEAVGRALGLDRVAAGAEDDELRRAGAAASLMGAWFAPRGGGGGGSA